MLTATFMITTALAAAPPLLAKENALPRNMTPAEQRWVQDHPIAAPRGMTSPPSGPIHCAAEYEPMDAILLAWEGSNSWKNILATMAANITTIGNADVVISIESSSEQTSALSSVVSAGADSSRVRFVNRTTDSIWIRDYGPRYIFEGDCRAIVDHTYNRPRPHDNAFNAYFAGVQGHQYYELPLVHGGGNYHLNTPGYAWSTELISNENPGMTDGQIVGYWQDYQNLATTITDAFPTSVDVTQHIDMWMCWASDTTCVVSDWPYDGGSIQDQICDSVSMDLQFQGYTVIRLPARSVNWTHYTYANSVVCNDLVLVPSYTNSQVSQFNDDAVAAWQQACPDKTIVSVPCENIVSSAGVMHCICMHIPAHRGGNNPTAYLRSPRGGQSFDAGDTVMIQWITDDDESVTGVDLQLSADGGSTWQVIAENTADDGQYAWTVPEIGTNLGVIRITAEDADGNLGSDQGEGFFEITGPVAGDVNGDGVVNVTDLLAVMASWGLCDGPCSADLNGDLQVDVTDLLMVIANW